MLLLLFSGAASNQFDGILPLSPAMLKKMQKRAEAKARAEQQANDDEEALFLLGN